MKIKKVLVERTLNADRTEKSDVTISKTNNYGLPICSHATKIWSIGGPTVTEIEMHDHILSHIQVYLSLTAFIKLD